MLEIHSRYLPESVSPINTSEFRSVEIPDAHDAPILAWTTDWLDLSVAHVPGIDSFLKRTLSGRTLIDLGAGDVVNGMARFAADMNVSRFVAVDKYFQPEIHRHQQQALSYLEDLSGHPSSQSGSISHPKTEMDGYRDDIANERKRDLLEAGVDYYVRGLASLQFEAVQADMVDFLRKQANDSGNVTLNAIDELIVPHGPYRNALFREISRVIGKEGRLLYRVFYAGDRSVLQQAGLQEDPSFTRLRSGEHIYSPTERLDFQQQVDHLGMHVFQQSSF